MQQSVKNKTTTTTKNNNYVSSQMRHRDFQPFGK